MGDSEMSSSDSDSEFEGSILEGDDEINEETDEKSVNLVKDIEETEEVVERIVRKKLNPILVFDQLVNPMWQEISAMFNEGAPFLVDGDSLMLLALSNEHWSGQLGGSTLHMVYLIETQLNIFISRGGTFQLVFFESWKNIWSTNSTLMLYRQIIIEHFSKNTNYQVHIIDHCYDDKFVDLVASLRPQFILINLDVIEDSEKLKNVNQKNAITLYCIQVLYYLSIGLPCVGSNNIQTDVFTVNAFYVEGSSLIGKLVEMWYDTFVDVVSQSPPKWKRLDTSLVKNMDGYNVRSLVTMLAAAEFSKENSNVDMLKLYLLNYVVMENLNIENRCCPALTESSDNLKELIESTGAWQECVYNALCSVNGASCDWSLVSDFWQGILFGHLCRFTQSNVDNSTMLGLTLAAKYESVISDLKVFGVELAPYPICSASMNVPWQSYAPSEINIEDSKLFRIENPLVLAFCGNILPKMSWMDPPLSLVNNQIHTEEHHYHSMKVITDEYDRVKNTVTPMPKDPWERKRYLRNIANHAKYMTMYGSSIEGRTLDSKAIVRANTKENKKEKKAKVSKKAQLIIDNNKSKKLSVQENKDKTMLSDFESDYKKSKKNVRVHLSEINMLINKFTVPSIYVEAQIWKAKILLKILKDTESTKVTQHNAKKELFLTVRKTLSSKTTLTVGQKELLSKALATLECEEIARRNDLPSVPTDNSDGWVRYQLQHLGPELERVSTGVPDSRVVGFVPDKWQKELFDIVDKRQSAVIVAPTSSGKTYASYYCMESVLREGTEGIVVYVAPTKALVNQVAATVYARFKNTVMGPGQSVYGVFTRDFRTNTTNCQILVTVPQCLELLLMSPRQHQWQHRLRYVIFDEVHCITSIGGVHWERCLTLIRCPFLALSATIRYPQQLHAWLQSSEDYKRERDLLTEQCHHRPGNSYRVHLVIHSERHSDLTKYTYSGKGLNHLHPYAHLDDKTMHSHGGIPAHMFLSPAETLQLYTAMRKAHSECTDLDALDPVVYFSENVPTGFITRNAVRDYELLLSSLLAKWFTECDQIFYETVMSFKPKETGDIIVGSDDIKYIIVNIVDLISTLREKNMLPAIVFSYNRHVVHLMNKKITNYLMQSDVKVHRRTEKLNDKKEKMEKKIRELREKDNKDSKAKVSRTSHTLSILDSGANSLRDVGVVDANDLKFMERRLVYSGFTKNDSFVQSLRHGVGMHHGGMNNKTRNTVEMFFRKRVLNVVFATGTLALGIHMPCKTAVIAGNSPYLNSLEYQQMSGRAGRRGFDTAGNVIFFALNQRKQHTLITSQLPSIQGTFPMNVTLAMRLMLLVTDVTEKGKPSQEATDITVSRVMALLENSLVYKQRPNVRDQVKHFFSYSLQFMIMQDYLDGKGSPLKWCGLATHLHYHEPGNLALVYLLRTGVLRNLCLQKNLTSEDIQLQLVITLAHLFTKIPVTKQHELKKFKNSKVFLDPLPELIEQALVRYNNEVNFVFNQYFANVARNCADRDTKLPLSNIDIATRMNEHEQMEHKDSLNRKILDFCKPTLICSTFAALSGNDDTTLYSKDKTASNIKQNLCSDLKIVPTIDTMANLNGYAVDYYRHGIIKAMIDDNGLKAGEEFSSLKDFMLVIKTVFVSLNEMKPKQDDDPVLRQFNMLNLKYSELFHTSFPTYNY